MSAQSTAPRPEPRSRRSGASPSGATRLRLVGGARPQLSTGPFVLLLSLLLVAGMVGLLLLNTTLQNQAFQASQLKRQAVELQYAEEELDQRVITTSSTTELTRRASELGLRPNFSVAFVVLPDGRIVGAPKPADPLYLPSAVTRTEEEQRRLYAERAIDDAQKRAKQEQTTLEANRNRILADQAKARAEAEKAAQQQAAQQPGAQQAGAQQPAGQQPGQPTQKPSTAPTQGGR